MGTVSKNDDGDEVVSSLSDVGGGWVIRAVPVDAENFSYLLNSDGQRCRNKLSSKVTYSSCGEQADGSETWK